MTERKCHHCDKHMPKGTEHVEFDDELYCMDCIEESTLTYYYLGGEFLATDDDGAVKVYAWEDEEHENTSTRES